MEIIENQKFDEERALYGSSELLVRNCSFDGPADAMAKREKGILMKSILKEHIFWEAPCKEDLLKNAKEKYNLYMHDNSDNPFFYRMWDA